jgi:hypothetical protein
MTTKSKITNDEIGLSFLDDAPEKEKLIQKAEKNEIALSKNERRDQMLFLEKLLFSEVSHEKIIRRMKQQHPEITDKQITRMVGNVLNAWSDEDAKMRPFLKSASIRRHRDHIEVCKEMGDMRTVAQLEKNLAQIEGTIDKNTNKNVTNNIVNEKVLILFNAADEAEVMEAIERQTQKAFDAQVIDIPT